MNVSELRMRVGINIIGKLKVTKLPTPVEILKLVSLLPIWKLPNPTPIKDKVALTKKISLRNLYFLSPPPKFLKFIFFIII